MAEIDPTTDLYVRMALAEGDPTPASWQAVAGVIKNRAAASGMTPLDVVSDHGQFEAWGDNKARQKAMSIATDSPEYQAALKAVQPVLAGSVAVPYDSFYAPDLVQGRGGKTPAWDDGSGKPVGTQLFFKTGYKGSGHPVTVEGPHDDALYAALTGEAPAGDHGAATVTTPAHLTDDALYAAMADPNGGAAPAAAGVADGMSHDALVTLLKSRGIDPATVDMKGSGAVVDAKSGSPLNEAQTQTYEKLNKGRILDLNAAPGSKALPLAQVDDNVPTTPGTFYVDKGGMLQEVPVAAGALANLGAGLMQAPLDIAGAPSRLFPDSEITDRLAANRLVYGAQHGASPMATLGRVGGDLALTAPVMGAAASALAPAAAAAGPVGEVLSGGYQGNKLLQGLSLAARGATEGAGYSALASGASDQPFGSQVLSGAAGGAVLSPLLAGAAGAGRNLITGGADRISPVVRDLASTAVDKYGIPLRVSQIKGVGDRATAVKDSERLSQLGTGYAENNADQHQAFTRAVAKTFGSDADKLTPDVMQAAKTRIGSVFDKVAANTVIGDTDKLLTNLGAVAHEAAQVLPEDSVKPLLKQVESIASTIEPGANGAPGTISGDAYQALTRKGAPLDRATTSTDPNIRHYAQQIKGALDDALEASASPADLDALKEARWQYKNLMTVKNLAAKAGVEGEISPLLLRGAVNNSFKSRAFSGAGDLGELSDIAQTFMKEPPNSGTAPRLMEMLKSYGGAGLLSGAGVDMMFHDPALATKLGMLAAGSGGVKLANNAVRGAYNRSAMVRNRLLDAGGNQGIPSAVDLTRGFVPAAVLLQNRMLQLPSPVGAGVQPNQ